MLIENDSDAVILLMVAKVILDEALHSSKHLAELASDALLPSFNDSSDV
jgi:hypothetical protein